MSSFGTVPEKISAIPGLKDQDYEGESKPDEGELHVCNMKPEKSKKTGMPPGIMMVSIKIQKLKPWIVHLKTCVYIPFIPALAPLRSSNPSMYLCAQCEEVVLSKNLASLTRHAWSAYRL
ncbi:hypothetical protein NC652_005083 [Populus alba x Populus x berolinensis]|uniref:Uncharacterized protein n=1 Tax=Populus alba x Populus x berolinensis TaxID=444605 RepID=A0AAD6WAR7_9ROSI|nr:hypothetical protein NC652_005083 [Populus alba x Populus x berolinensis]KAJ7005602.1 hypothetical protein NC653_005040 [Populus alba x Populus x berolinensis]